MRCEAPFDTADDVDLALSRPAAPSPTQSHGTVMAALLAGFVLLALLLWLSVRDVGPFTAKILTTTQVGDTAAVTLEIRNEGDKAGHGKCRIGRVSDTGDQQTEFQFLSKRVPANGTITETVEVPLTDGARTGQVSC